MPKASTFAALIASQVIESDSVPLLTNAGDNKRVSISEMRQVVGPGWSLTINAALETGVSDEAKIQAAISRAISTGKTQVFIPGSMIPYDASLVTFDDAVQMIRENGDPSTYDVKAYGAAGDGVTDDSAAIQAAIDAAQPTYSVIRIPAATYKCETGLTIYMGTQIQGETLSAYGGGFGFPPKASTILFEPTIADSDFVTISAAGGSGGGFKFHIAIETLFVLGNGGTNSRYGLNLDSVIYSNFTNLTFENFATPIRCASTINNRFENLALYGSATGAISCVDYAGGIETSDVWTHCTFTRDPGGTGLSVGVRFLGTSVGVRFEDCLWEAIDDYGMDIARECYGIIVTNGYCEDVPLANNPDGCMFRMGYTGTTLVGQNHLTVVGGIWMSRNAGTVGNFIDCDYATGVELVAPTIARYTAGIRTTANTRVNAVAVLGAHGFSWASAFYTDATKISGVYPSAVIGVGSSAGQSGRLIGLDVGDVTVTGTTNAGALTATTGAFSNTLTTTKTTIAIQGSGAATARQSINFTNTSGNLTLGIEGSSAQGLALGSTAYATVLGTDQARPLMLGTDNTVRVTIDSAGKAITQASASATAGFNLPHGAAPSSPADGDIWTTTAGLISRINGVTVPMAPTASPTFTGTVTLPVGLTGVIRADTGVVSVDTDVTDIVAAATTSAAGKVELATDGENAANVAVQGTDGRLLFAKLITTADQSIGTTPANVTGFTAALAATTKYAFKALICYMNGTTTTAVHALRVVYSGTLGTVANGESFSNIYGTSGAPNVWAGLFRNCTIAVNATMPTTTGGIGNTGSATLHAYVTIEGVICTNGAGDLNIEAVSSAATSLNVQAGSTLLVWKI